MRFKSREDRIFGRMEDLLDEEHRKRKEKEEREDDDDYDEDDDDDKEENERGSFSPEATPQ